MRSKSIAEGDPLKPLLEKLERSLAGLTPAERRLVLDRARELNADAGPPQYLDAPAPPAAPPEAHKDAKQ